MTIACALARNEVIYLAADSAVAGLPTTGRAHKLSHSDVLPLAWATAGDEAIGDQFGDWLRSQLASAGDPTKITWDALVENCVLRLAALNGIRSRAGQANHVSWNPGDALGQVLLVGFVGERAEIAHLEVSGDWTLHMLAGRSFTAIGSGQYHAAMTYELLLERGLLSNEGPAAVRDVAEAAARHAPHCSLPVDIVAVTRDGVVAVA